MGKLNEPGFTGRTGTVVFYYMNGQYIMRSLPRKYKQTKATRARAGEFGRASGIGRCIREQLGPIISTPSDIAMQRRLVSAVFEWLRSGADNTKKRIRQVEELTGFNLSDNKNLTGNLHGFPDIQINNVTGNLIQIKIPSFIPVATIKVPRSTTKIICSIAVGVTDLNKIDSIEQMSAVLEIEYNKNEFAEQLISFKLQTKEKVLIVAGISLSFIGDNKGKDQPTKNKSYATEVIASAVCL